MFLFDTDVITNLLKPRPSSALIRRLDESAFLAVFHWLPTGNTKHFARIDGLTLSNWLIES